MQNQITVVEAAIVLALTSVFLAPYLYYMTEVKARNASRSRVRALISTASFLLGAALVFAVLYATSTGEAIPGSRGYCFLMLWKGSTILCIDMVELIQVVDPLIHARFSHPAEPSASTKARVLIFSLVVILHAPFIGATVWHLGPPGVEHCWAAPMVTHVCAAAMAVVVKTQLEQSRRLVLGEIHNLPSTRSLVWVAVIGGCVFVASFVLLLLSLIGCISHQFGGQCALCLGVLAVPAVPVESILKLRHRQRRVEARWPSRLFEELEQQR